MNRSLQRLAALVLGALSPTPAFASVVINGTRVVYPGREREVTIQLTNQGGSPSLVQTWLDRGDPRSTPEQSDAPFVLTPPITRIEPNRGQALRMMYTGQPLPPDRESVFWLNVLEVPPTPPGEMRSYVQLAFRSRIKVFFRPEGLSGPADAAGDKLHWRAVSGTDGQVALVCKNAAPYYVSFSRLTVGVEGRTVAYDQGGMVAPFSTASFAIPGLSRVPAAGSVVEVSVINDYGGGESVKAKLEP